MKIHLIAIGGAVMHNMALALHEKGYQISGSDDEIFEPSKSRLAAKGLLPDKWGWFPEKITEKLDVVEILEETKESLTEEEIKDLSKE